jgi:hypothetical protein
MYPLKIVKKLIILRFGSNGLFKNIKSKPMKSPILILSFLLFSGILSAQDTIFIKTGEKIPVIIVEKNDTEIKYKKPGAPGSAAIYSVFISDIASIHYKDGIIADYTSPGTSDDSPKTPIEMAGTMRTMKLSLGLSYCNFQRNTDDDLLLFWQNQTGRDNLEVGGNPASIPINLKMSFVLGQSGRNWIGDELQLIFTPEDAIYVSDNSNSDEIKLKAFYYNIIMYYGHTLNHKKNLAAIIEPGLDIAFMSGHIKLDNTVYDISGNLGVGFHIALGADWLISKRLLASARIGQRFMNIEESHESSTSTTGYQTFYVNRSVNEDLLSVNWNGPYATIGLSFAFYTKMKLGNE